MTEAIIGFVALAVGLTIGFLVARNAGAGALSKAHADASVAQARADAEAARAAEVTAASDRREQELRAEHERYVSQVRADHEALKTEFKALSAQALEAQSREFLARADERFTRANEANKVELEKREQSVKQLVEPMKVALDEVKRQTTEADKARAESQAQLSEQIRRMLDSTESLGKSTESLRSALRRPEVRGRWGELHLRRVVEVAGLVNGVDFAEQSSDTTADGNRLRPDMIVTLSGGRKIIVDAKTPLDALLDIDTDPEHAEEHAARHVRNVRQRVKELSSKAYREQFGSDVDFSVLFLPAESFLQVATEHDPNLLTDAYESGVIIATPTVLVAMLRTVAHTWRAEALAKNAQDVLENGRELYKRLSTMGAHLAKVGAAIDRASSAYNDTIGSMERQVLPQARRFASLQGIEKEIEVQVIDGETRAITAAELAPADDDEDLAHLQET
ncbi:DNA recombination protein RmuC [Demequina sp.]|uniref:DNA recombination protein RmuC n=1 Tax=Demequina sp. TaxID=2050685 RepID=UPI003D0B8E36